MRELLGSFGLADVADVAVVWVLVWIALVSLRATRARTALVGVGILVGLFFVARFFGLELTTWILQGFLAVSVLIAVVIFQEDLRRLFEQIAALGLATPTLKAVVDGVDTLTRVLVKLADERRGALVVIPGREPLDLHLDGGVALDARLSEPLLLSLFDPHSPGHDGAVLLAGDRVTRFAVHLPLSSDHAQLGQRGTRHAAALGLAERCDALSLVVSEERGTISVAHRGRLRTLDRSSTVNEEIRRFLAGLAPAGEVHRRRRPVLHRWREGLLALPVALLLWVLAIPGGAVVEVVRTVPVEVRGLPSGTELLAVEPSEVRVRLSGRRRDLLLAETADVKVAVDAILVGLGRRSLSIANGDVKTPPGVEVQGVEPDTVKISVRSRDPTGPPG